MTKMIKNIIFDLGGVILNIDYHRTSRAFQELEIKEFDALYSQAQQSDLFDLLETGMISPEAFRKQVRELVGIPLKDSQIDTAWNAMLLDLPKERIAILQAAKSNYNTFLLSNTNVIHLDSYTDQLQKEHGIKSLGELFKKEYYSHEIKLRKPNNEAFEYVLTANHLKAEETLFIDDSIQHIEGAQSIGINTFFMDAKRNLELKDIFENGLLKENFQHV